MYGFNGQVPGPLIRVAQNATITVRFHNQIDLPSCGALARRATRQPVRRRAGRDAGGSRSRARSYTYTVHFPDAGIYWYHPHVREDIEQAMGLYGNMLVDSPDPAYYSPVNREQALMLSDLMINADTLIPFGKESPDFALMGRVGNVPLVNGEPAYALTVKRGEVVRFYLTNVASSRTWNLSIGGVPMKVVASRRQPVRARGARRERGPGAGGAVRRRRAVRPRRALSRWSTRCRRSTTTGGNSSRRSIRWAGSPLSAAPADAGLRRGVRHTRANAAVTADIAKYRPYFNAAPDKRITLTVATSALPLITVQFMSIDTAYFHPVEWVDGMPEMNWLSTGKQVRWILRDDATGKENEAIDWHVKRGAVVKLRIFNDPKSFHPMQHPIHLHGQRMLVISRDGVRTKNLVWKDTVLIPVGSTVDLLIDASNPGDWMLHCHIAEHLGAGMMTVMHVDP